MGLAIDFAAPCEVSPDPYLKRVNPLFPRARKTARNLSLDHFLTALRGVLFLRTLFQAGSPETGCTDVET